MIELALILALTHTKNMSHSSEIINSWISLKENGEDVTSHISSIPASELPAYRNAIETDMITMLGPLNDVIIAKTTAERREENISHFNVKKKAIEVKMTVLEELRDDIDFVIKRNS